MHSQTLDCKRGIVILTIDIIDYVTGIGNYVISGSDDCYGSWEREAYLFWSNNATSQLSTLIIDTFVAF